MTEATATSPTSSKARPSGSAPGRRPSCSLSFVVGSALVLLAAGLASRSISDNSVMTHVATGRLILDGGIPRTDPYSFTAVGQDWIVQSWLPALVYGLVERAVGSGGLRVLSGVLVGVTMALVWRLTRPAGGLLGRITIAGLVMLCSIAFWTPRPLLVGLLLLALTLLVIEEGRDPRWMVPIMWVWANSHGSFPLGLVAIGCFWVGTRLDKGPTGQLQRTFLWALAGTALAAVNPLGPTLLVFPAQVLGRMDILSHVVEWQSPTFSTGYARLFLLQVVIAVLALVRRPSYRAAVPLLVFLVAALFGLRNIPLASIVMVPGLAVGLAGWGTVDGSARRPANLAILAVLAAVAVAVVVSALSTPAFDLSTFPTDAFAYLQQRGVIGSSARLATTDTDGNALELLYGTGNKVFIDDRYDMYPIDVLNDYLVLNGGQTTWNDVLAEHGIDHVLWPRGAPLASLILQSPDWHVEYQDASAIVACRRSAPTCR